MMRIGHGYDVHALGEGDSVVLGGVQIPFERPSVRNNPIRIISLCGGMGDLAGGAPQWGPYNGVPPS